ncbi:MAG: hypothetical protein LBJ01_07140, partial [Tannerella sp.]|nr:hypothetical protein [Tannerella sp.]
KTEAEVAAVDSRPAPPAEPAPGDSLVEADVFLEEDENETEEAFETMESKEFTEKFLSDYGKEPIATALSPRENAARLKHLRTFARKGTKVFVRASCWEDPTFEHVFLTEFGRRRIWTLVKRPQEADFILSVQAIPRLMANPIYGDIKIYDMYALIFDREERLLWKSDLYFGNKVRGYVWSDLKKNACVKFVKDALVKDVSKARSVYDGMPDILGIRKVPLKRYESSEVLFWRGIDYFNQHNHKDAMKLFTETLRQNPHHAVAYKYRAISYSHLSRYNNARDDMVTAMRLDPLCVQNDTIYADIMYGGYKKTVRHNNRSFMILGIANAVAQSVNAAAAISTGGSTQPVASSGISTAGRGAATARSTERKVCSSCNGTGQSSAQERPAFYNYNEEDYSSSACSICGSRSNHYHKPCPSCMGKGYR